MHLSTNDVSGGAARAAYRLHSGLRSIGCDSTMFVMHKRSSESTVKAFTPSVDWVSRLRYRLRQVRLMLSLGRYRTSRPVGYELFSDDRTRYGAALLEQLPSCDIVNLHWVARFVDYRPFFARVPRHTPVVWTLHDMNAFTGGCHYDYGCGRYRERCGACPQLGSDDEQDLSRRVWERKHRAFAQVEPGRLHIVTPSRWLAREAEQSTLLERFPISVIPNSLDTDVFAPREREVARAALEIPRDANVVLFASDSVENKRKGFTLLAKALSGLNAPSNLFLVSLGSGEPNLEGSVPHLHLGHIGNDRLLALVYSAADLFVIPSLQEAFGLTALEAIACGTPVVGFDVGGIPDMVRPGVTGLLAPSQDVTALRAAIVELLQDPARRAEMSANCRRIAVEEYALEIQAKRYVDLYEKMLAHDQH